MPRGHFGDSTSGFATNSIARKQVQHSIARSYSIVRSLLAGRFASVEEALAISRNAGRRPKWVCLATESLASSCRSRI